MLFEQWRIGPMENFVYVFGEPGGAVALVDPAFDVPELLDRVASLGCRVTDILATHGHFDHVQGIPDLKKRTGATVWAHESAKHPHDRPLRDGERFRVADGAIEVACHHTPGHIQDAVCYQVDGTHLLTGDTLFIGECGRIDLPGSDPTEMWRTLNERLPRLDPKLRVCPGHDYGPTPTDTLGRQLATNYTLQPRTLGEFLAFMSEP